MDPRLMKDLVWISHAIPRRHNLVPERAPSRLRLPRRKSEPVGNSLPLPSNLISRRGFPLHSNRTAQASALPTLLLEDTPGRLYNFGDHISNNTAIHQENSSNTDIGSNKDSLHPSQGQGGERIVGQPQQSVPGTPYTSRISLPTSGRGSDSLLSDSGIAELFTAKHLIPFTPGIRFIWRDSDREYLFEVVTHLDMPRAPEGGNCFIISLKGGDDSIPSGYLFECNSCMFNAEMKWQAPYYCHKQRQPNYEDVLNNRFEGGDKRFTDELELGDRFTLALDSEEENHLEVVIQVVGTPERSPILSLNPIMNLEGQYGFPGYTSQWLDVPGIYLSPRLSPRGTSLVGYFGGRELILMVVEWIGLSDNDVSHSAEATKPKTELTPMETEFVRGLLRANNVPRFSFNPVHEGCPLVLPPDLTAVREPQEKIDRENAFNELLEIRVEGTKIPVLDVELPPGSEDLVMPYPFVPVYEDDPELLEARLNVGISEFLMDPEDIIRVWY